MLTRRNYYFVASPEIFNVTAFPETSTFLSKYPTLLLRYRNTDITTFTKSSGVTLFNADPRIGILAEHTKIRAGQKKQGRSFSSVI